MVRVRVRFRVTVRVRVRGRVMVMVVCVLKLVERLDSQFPEKQQRQHFTVLLNRRMLKRFGGGPIRHTAYLHICFHRFLFHNAIIFRAALTPEPRPGKPRQYCNTAARNTKKQGVFIHNTITFS